MASAAAMILPFLLLALAMVGVARPDPVFNYSSSSPSAAATTGLVSWTDEVGQEAGECEIRHSSGGRFAESLYIGRNGWNATASDAVHMYDRETGKCTGGLDFKECGHFAFMVKPNFSRIGCARYYKDKDGVHH